MADHDPDEDEDAGPPPPELTPYEKIEALKDALSNGEMGPSSFDSEYQPLWMKIKADEGLASSEHQRGNRKSYAPAKTYAPDDD